jgi:serine/threonine protein kinase
MEFVRGQNLDQVYRQIRVDLKNAVSWIIQAARIIDFANERGVIHCDLKPSNLLLDEVGRIRVTDFGLARRAFDEQARCLAGTPAFMAPEQVDPCWGEVSARTDVWGLGSILFFLLSGRPPHHGSDVAEVFASVVSGTPVDCAWAEASHVPSTVVDAMRRCLTKSPSDRFSTPGGFADELTNVALLPSPR